MRVDGLPGAGYPRRRLARPTSERHAVTPSHSAAGNGTAEVVTSR